MSCRLTAWVDDFYFHVVAKPGKFTPCLRVTLPERFDIDANVLNHPRNVNFAFGRK